MLVVEAPFEKIWSWLHVLAVYVFGMVVEEWTNQLAEVVENARPWFCERKYEAEVVAQRNCVDSKYWAEVVEKKLFWVFQ